MRLLSEINGIPNDLADSEDQEKSDVSCIQLQYFLRILFVIQRILLLNFKPDIGLKASNILMSSLNDLKEPSTANVASSANSVLLNSLSNIVIHLKSLLSVTAAANSSLHIINR